LSAARSFCVMVLAIALTGVFNACDKEDPEEGVLFERINGFVISSQGAKLLATDNGLYSFDERSGTYTFVPSAIEHAPLSDLAYSGTDPEGELWLATRTGAYNHTAQFSYTEENSGLDNNQITHLCFDDHQGAYFAAPDGLSILYSGDWTISRGLDSLYVRYGITDIASATNGYTYVTTDGGGIERFKADVDGISGATIFDTDWTQLESNHIHTVFIDDTVQVYGTSRGVAMHFSEYTKWDWQIYTTSDGLISDTVLAVVKDGSDRWWFGTPRGVSTFDGSGWTNYAAETDDPAGNRIMFLALDSDGSVWSASDEGLSQFIDDRWVSYPK
jgi:ligand-binding sensor domain-containing protein